MNTGGSDLPKWAARATRLFRTLFLVLSGLGFLLLALRLIDHALGADLLLQNASWLSPVSGVLVAAWLLCGAVWLVGEGLAGFREPPG